MDIHGLTSAVVVFISLPVIVLGAVNLQISGNTEVAEAFRLVCSSPLNSLGRTSYTFYRSPTPGFVGTKIGTIGYFPNNSPPCDESGIYPIPYPFGCDDNGTKDFITINVTTGTDLTEHDKYWRCQTLVDNVAGNNNEVHVIIYDPVKTVQIVAEDGTTLTLPVVISESNTNTKLLCTTGPSGSRPEAKLTWWRTGTPGQQITSGVTGLTGQKLTTKHVTARSTLNIANRAFNGVSVFCKASLNGRDTQSDQVLLSVTYQPSITSLYVEGNNNVVSEDDTVKIICETDSNPTSTFTWTRQSDIASLPETGNMLTLSSVQCSDTTFFTCTANNNIGSAATKNIQLFVQCQPRINSIAPQEPAYGAVGESINITVQHIIAFPPPTFLWEKVNSDALPPSNQTDTNTSSTLTVRRLDVDDFGSYSVTIDNTIGKPFVFYIEVESASYPLKPTNVTVIASTTNSVTLSWTPGFDGGAPQKFSFQYRRDGGSVFSNYSKAFLDENSQFMTSVIDGLEEGTVYYFRMIAINRFGESPVTGERRVVTTEHVAKPESNVGPVIGGAIGGVVVGVLGTLAAIYVWRRYRERRTKSEATTNRTEERGNDSTYQDLTQNRSASTSEYQTLNLSEQATPVHLNLELNVASTSRNDPHYQNLTHN